MLPRAIGTGTGFFITDDGYLISNYHVVKAAAKVRVVTRAGASDASVVRVDAGNDLALLKVQGRFAALPVAPSRVMPLGTSVATIGFPNIGLQGLSPKVAEGKSPRSLVRRTTLIIFRLASLFSRAIQVAR